MLLFYCATHADLTALSREGIQAPEGIKLRLYTRLEHAQEACSGAILLVDAARLPEVQIGQKEAWVSTLPAAALQNLDPFRPPRPVEAGGGYVVRSHAQGLDLLLIYRRGAWDLPKGKRDPGETRKACALREVGEEIGIERLRLLGPLGTTTHAYPEKKSYSVKTTYWYLMETPETHFTPQTKEGIEEVAWVPWEKARQRLDYATLRTHMKQVEDRVFEGMKQKGG